MGQYRYVGGSVCEVHGHMKLDQFGQAVELSDELAKTIAIGGGVIVPEARFAALNITADELAAYKFPGQRASAPKDFQEKVLEAWSEYHEFQRDLEDPAGALGHEPLGGVPHTEEVTNA